MFNRNKLFLYDINDHRSALLVTVQLLRRYLP